MLTMTPVNICFVNISLQYMEVLNYEIKISSLKYYVIKNNVVNSCVSYVLL